MMMEEGVKAKHKLRERSKSATRTLKNKYQNFEQRAIGTLERSRSEEKNEKPTTVINPDFVLFFNVPTGVIDFLNANSFSSSQIPPHSFTLHQQNFVTCVTKKSSLCFSEFFPLFFSKGEYY